MTPGNGKTSRHSVTEVDGLEVIAREPAMGAHPRWTDRQTYFAGVEKVLLSDGTERWVCLGMAGHPCTFSSKDGTKSVVAHRNGTHNLRRPRRTTMYPDQVVRMLVTEVEKAKRAGVRGHAEVAAAALNAAGVETIHGGPWTSNAVSHIYNKHRGLVRVRLAKTSRSTGSAKAAHISTTTSLPDDPDGARRWLRTWARNLGHVQQAILQILDEPAAAIDPVLVEKARKYDDLQKLLGGQ